MYVCTIYARSEPCVQLSAADLSLTFAVWIKYGPEKNWTNATVRLHLHAGRSWIMHAAARGKAGNLMRELSQKVHFKPGYNHSSLNKMKPLVGKMWKNAISKAKWGMYFPPPRFFFFQFKHAHSATRSNLFLTMSFCQTLSVLNDLNMTQSIRTLSVVLLSINLTKKIRFYSVEITFPLKLGIKSRN